MVLILTPDSTSSRTFSRWQGPAQVVKVCSPYSYIVEHNSNQHHLHANKLKPFVVAADEVTCCVDFDTVCAALSHSTSENEHDLFISEGCAVITDADQDFGEIPSFGGMWVRVRNPQPFPVRKLTRHRSPICQLRSSKHFSSCWINFHHAFLMIQAYVL